MSKGDKKRLQGTTCACRTCQKGAPNRSCTAAQHPPSALYRGEGREKTDEDNSEESLGER